MIFVSALSDAADKDQGFKVGAVDYITKPFDVPSVRTMVKTHLADLAPPLGNCNTETDESCKHPQPSAVENGADHRLKTMPSFFAAFKDSKNACLTVLPVITGKR